jgi:PAS domain S-box-containing protein
VLEKRPRILAIDDIPENLITLGAVLSPEYDLQFATSAAQGLAQARESRPDLILLDVMMPEMDGFETCRILRTDPLTREIPVIFLTALDSAEDETRGLETGAVDFISKPINPAIVRARIRTHLRIRQAESELRAREARFRTMIEAAHDGILLAEIESRRIVDANPTLCAMTGHDRHALLAMGLEDLHAPGDLAPALDNYGRQARGELNEAREAPIRRKDASVFHADVTCGTRDTGTARSGTGARTARCTPKCRPSAPCATRRATSSQYVALFSDITAIKEHESQLEHIAHYDALTDLPNRVLLADRLHAGHGQAQRAACAWRWPTSTWTASRRSTTSTATKPATSCWPRWPTA